MNPTAKNDWQRVREIFYDALGQPPEERLQFVHGVCGEDDALRIEVESLIDSLDSAEHFLETPAVVQVVAENTVDREQRLSRGEMLRHYEIAELIGSGGMGEVYLARDSRLNRNVAIKVLRQSLFPDAHANGRLLREARAAALLEHPNICQIYEISETDEHNFIVMQYVVGTTVADTLASGRIETTKALDLAIQIVEGLAEAHDQGIIHRDIKPANIIVNNKGQAKILDFGLAKFIEAESTAETSQRLNSSGALMGTVPFMSPEQLRGKRVDERTDIFSFGALVYEMIAGEPAFKRDNNAETISSILNDDPDWSAIPNALRPIVQKCLAKSVDERYGSTSELLVDLLEARDIDFSVEPNVPRPTTVTPQRTTDGKVAKEKRHFYFWQSSGDEMRDLASVEDASERSSVLPTPYSILVVGVLLVVASVATVGFRVWQLSGTRHSNFDSLKPVRLVSWKSGASTGATDFRISHSGKMVAYSSSEVGGSEAIYIKQTSGGEDVQVTKDPWRNLSPLWSPDDQNIAYISVRENKPGIYMSPAFGGVATPLAITERENMALRHWAHDGTAIFFEEAGNLFRLELSTGEITKVTQLPDSPIKPRYFSFSPNEKQLVYCDVVDGQNDVWVMPLGGGEPTRLTDDTDGELRPLWHPDGDRILYNVFRNGFVQLNLVSAVEQQPPVQVTRGEGHYVLIDIPPQGGKVYYSSTDKKSDINSVDVALGRENDIAAESDLEYWSAMSPDGKSLVYQSSTANVFGKWYESPFTLVSSDGQRRQLATKGFDARWLPDSRRLAVLRKGARIPREYDVCIVDTVTGEERRITNEDVMTPAWTPMPIMRVDISVIDFSPDAKRFIYVDMRRPQNAKIGPLDTDGITNVTKNENPNVTYSSPKFSRDGSRFALVSLEEFADRNQKPVRRLHVFEGDVGREIFSTNETARMIGWSIDSHVILATVAHRNPAFPTSVDIVAVSMSGTRRKLSSLRDTYMRSLAISPDGKTLAFVGYSNQRDDIWTVPLTEGAEPEQITFSGSSRVFFANLVFSPDGKTIYFDKQEEVNTISMFENFD